MGLLTIPTLVGMWDPNTWTPDEHQHRIYSSWDVDGVYAIVDAIDFPWASQFLWSIHDRKKAFHPYLHRKVTVFHGPEGERYESPITGKVVRNYQRTQYTEFLHRAIMKRTGIEQPTPDHKEVDHRDRDTLNCRRINLRWATRKEQVANSRQSTNGHR